MNNRFKLYRQGYSDREAANELGITRTCFCSWRIRRGLPPNRPIIKKSNFDYNSRPKWERQTVADFERLLIGVDDEAREVGRRLTESSITDVMNYFREGIV